MDSNMIEVSLYDESFKHHTDNTSSSFYFKSQNIKFDRDYLNRHEIGVCTQYSLDSLISANHKYKFIVFTEPMSIISQYIDFVYKHKIYELVDQVFIPWIKSYPKTQYYPYGDSWIKPEDHKIYSKTKNISMIASDKNHCPMHETRHKLAKIFKGDGFGKYFNNHVEYKLDSLKDYRYQVVVENDIQEGWFTEKLIDCFVTGTIPIYYGTTSLPGFDRNGMITAKHYSVNELEYIISKINCQGEELYNSESTQNAIKYNFELAKKYLCKDDWIYNKITEFERTHK